MTPKQVVEMAKDKGARSVDFKFCDIHGRWQHFSAPVAELTEDLFKDGLGFDGSSIRGWKGIEASDMLVMPDASTAIMDPFISSPTLSLVCDIEDPLTREGYDRDPRAIAKKAEAYLKSTGVGDTAFFGPEAEFFVFDTVRYATSPNHVFHFCDSNEPTWNNVYR